jgi:exonuclease SbcC
MILKRIEFKNIRSYSDESIDFPLGKTLFEGDIGSGKSSILMAIEFALFGLGSETGGSLLRVGEKEASVKLLFDVDGAEYEITRGLVRKGSRVHQTVGHVRTPSEELDLSPTELKEKILDILKFNEAPDPKAQSRIYRYAVYTPQEDMKSILVMAPEDRLQILRRAFGIEDYRVAANNAEAIAREVRAKMSELKSAAEEAEELRARVAQETGGLGAMTERSASLSKEERTLSEELDDLRAEQERLRENEIRLVSASKELEAQNRIVERVRAELDEVREEKRRTGESLREAESVVEEPKLSPRTKPKAELEEDVRTLEERSRRLAILRDRVDQKIGEYRSIMKDGVCPVCDRPVKADEFVEKEKSKSIERQHVEEEAGECEAELGRARELLQERIAHDSASEMRALQEARIEEGRRRLERAEEKLLGLTRELEEAESSLDVAKRQLASLEGTSERLERLEKLVESTEGKLRLVREESAQTRARVEEREKALREYEERLERAESAAERARRLGEYRVWLEDYFAPTVGAIEKQVLTNVNQEFDSNFKKWFSILVGDPQKEVRIDENFSPVVSQDGYDQESEYLSGGERTSVALAYRLALNTLVREVSTGMKSNILILDEPTDGFSKEQLGSVREILDEVGCRQTIIVSHEKELESFADQILRVTKSHGESKVESAGP